MTEAKEQREEERVNAMLFFVFTRGLAILLTLATLSAYAAEFADKRFDINITHGKVPADQRVLRVEKGDAVRLRVTSDAAGDLHLHGYKLETKVVPDRASELGFKAFATGRYPLEWHGADKGAPSRSHHGPPLATLEVRPR